MGTTKVVATFSGRDYEMDPVERLKDAVAHAYACEKSQSDIFYEDIFSIGWIIHENEGNIPETIRALEIGFINYLKPIYPNGVTVEIYDVEEDSDAPSDSVQLNVFIEVLTDTNKTINLARAVMYDKSGLRNLIPLINDARRP